MLFRSIFIITVLIGLIFFVFVQSEQSSSVSSDRLKSKLPSIVGPEASQWLSTRNIPSRRWRRPHVSQPSAEVDQAYKQLQSLNDNGIRQFDTQSFEGVSMEVIFEMVYKQQNNAASR
ncbi:unnamed protein product [Adineta steineri]|uniref:Uncharacterized protein n=1 Tax=Adineta steineri TaxID=433720 RepID=A0A814EMP2_9BILA|nr:unnamed protein product [Adineta steineri]CAF0970068.1 unnamed protein product [Adineta steineri]CAF1037419.1 unnamed protein product [Adineta steineri]